MSNPNHASSSTKSPSPSSNLSLLISNLGSFISVKLDSTNFIIWKDQWEHIPKATGLTLFVDGIGVQPTPRVHDSSNQEVTNPEFLQWIVDDAHLTSCICGTLSLSIYPVVLNCNSGNYRGGGNSREGGRPSGYSKKDYSQNSHGYGGYVQNTFQKSSGLFLPNSAPLLPSPSSVPQVPSLPLNSPSLV
ncbi:hypothetical protein Vadar_020756 [Vaccinium darrowii]|uniref:Uncharacterized protein n=1 Tax=Vaccinium darrowii TaxID=229202 RepID=A0ACB7YH29_9ERIC|nr:hypothetical protein Vadar_020756 [Vaccinium darrowii]